jgi:hypothetical protein
VPADVEDIDEPLEQSEKPLTRGQAGVLTMVL